MSDGPEAGPEGVEGVAAPALCCARLGGPLDPAAGVDGLGLRHGDRLTLGVPAERRPPAGAELGVIGGPAAGLHWPLHPGPQVVGRGTTSDLVVPDPQVSRRHFRLHVTEAAGGDPAGGGVVTIADEGSANGTVVDGERLPVQGPALPLAPRQVVEAGGSLFQLLPPPGPRAAMVADGPHLVFNRPPRRAAGAAAPARTLPPAPERPRTRRLSPAVVLAPLLVGVAGAFMFGPQLLLLAVLTPIGFVWERADERRADRKEFERDAARFRAAVDDAAAARAEDLAEEARQSHERLPGLAVLAAWARQGSPRLWERRPADDDFLHVRAGWGDTPSAGTVTVPEEGEPELLDYAAERLAGLDTVRSAAVGVSLASGGVYGLAGERPAVEALARSLLLQVAVLHSPRDVLVGAALGDDDPGWAWLGLLPHSVDDRGIVDGPLLGAGRAEADTVVRRLAATARRRAAGPVGAASSGFGGPPAPPLPRIVALLDGDAVDRATAQALVETAAAGGCSVLWTGRRVEDLPGESGLLLEVGAGPPALRVTDVGHSGLRRGLVPDLAGVDVALDVAGLLAPLVDQAHGGATGQVPALVHLDELGGGPPFTAQAVTARWAAAAPDLAAPVGVGGHGLFSLDLRADGPHALVGGTTGAGKSELLQTWVASLAAAHPPTRLAFLLIDYKGGAAFRECVELPHTAGFVTDLDPALARRALTALDAELKRREHLLAGAGAKDLPALEARRPDLTQRAW